MVSAIDLAYEKASRLSSCPPAKRKELYQQVCEQLAIGWTADDVRRGTKRQGGNLVDPYRFYYHAQLHLMPPPPKITLDLESGTCEQSVEPWFLEMRASYTIEELAVYYCSRLGIPPEEADGRFYGSLRWLMGRSDLDLVLFMIDVIRAMVEDGRIPPPLSPLALRDYERQARETLEQKETEMALMGVNGVVSRQRKPLPLS